MRAAGKVAVAAVLAPALACGSLVAVAVLATGTADAACAAPPTATYNWSDEQVTNATTIVAVGARLGVPAYGWVVAVATAMQESGLRNLGDLGPRNDHDSLGLFQQRPSQGWGTPAQVMDPVYAATAFYQKLQRVPDWQQLPLTVAAQRVQISAYPDAYAKWEPDARALVARIAPTLGVPACEAGPWANPLPSGSYTLSSGFGMRWGVMHYGQDLAAPTGTPIRAAAAGTVFAAGCTSPFCDRPGVVGTDGRPTTPGCGWRVILLHAGNVATMYCHASRLIVHAGQTVAVGQVIGYVGSTGHSTGPHLHLQVHLHAPPVDSSTATDPVAYLRSVGVAV
jgi:murein DD-endopeptidase MepM/ murein hydrolase activator NlpD